MHTMGVEWAIRGMMLNMRRSCIDSVWQRFEWIGPMQHVKAKIHIKASATQIAITSLTSYLPHLVLTTYNGLKTFVKRALGQLHGTWEIVA